jgi:AcrR family transcriptional regulator
MTPRNPSPLLAFDHGFKNRTRIRHSRSSRSWGSPVAHSQPHHTHHPHTPRAPRSARRLTRTAPRTPHVLEKRRRRREQILHGALRALREKGYHATTLDDIAEHVGMRKTALYHYFPDKEAILHECHRESLADLARIMRDVGDRPTASAKLAYVIAEHVRVMTDTLQGSPLAFDVAALSPARRARMIAGRDRYERRLRAIIAEGMRRGEFRPGDAKIAAFAILGAINWISRWYRPEGALHADEIGEQFVERLLNGLASGPRRGARSQGGRRGARPRALRRKTR